MAEFAERWKTEILPKQKSSSQKAAASHLRRHILPHLGATKLDSLGVENQQMFITRISSGRSRGTVKNVMVTLSSMLDTAKNWGYLCEGVDLDKLVLAERGVQIEARFFSAEQGWSIIEVAAYPWKLMFAIAAYCGLRAGEIMGLRAEDIDLEKQVLRVSQTVWRGRIQTAKTPGSETTVPLPGALCHLLRDHIPASGLLFVNRKGRPFTSERVVKKQLWPILDRLGIPPRGIQGVQAHAHVAVARKRCAAESGAAPASSRKCQNHARSVCPRC